MLNTSTEKTPAVAGNKEKQFLNPFLMSSDSFCKWDEN